MIDVDIHPERRNLNIISLCTGGGGLDRAVELAIPCARPVVCVERESFACANLVSQMQNGIMAPAALWSDARTFNGRPWRGLVDGVIGGIPCQPHSLAGKRLGREDERDLWGTARRIFVQSGAWFILIENVGGMLSSGGAERVRADLLRMGCTIEAGLFTAAEVGAKQERERLFILGLADPSRLGHQRWGGAGNVLRAPRCAEGEGDQRERRGDAADDRGDRMADAQGARRATAGSGPAFDAGWKPEPGSGAGLQPGSEHLADGDLNGSPSHGRDDGKERCLSQEEGGPDDRSALPGRGCGPLAHAGHAGPQGRRSSRDRSRECSTAERGRGDLGDPSGGDVPRARQSETHHEEPRQGLHRGPDGPVVDALGCGHDGRPGLEVGGAQQRAAVEWAGEGPLFAPGPGDVEAWRIIAERYPERLPAVSRYDLFRIEVRAAWLAAHGDPSARPGQAWGDTAPSSWLDASGPYGLRATVVQSIAQSTLRRGSDGLAARIDELRMLGNGVVDLEGAYALRTLVYRASRQNTGACELMGMMTP